MKTLIASVLFGLSALASLASPAFAQEYVHPYTRSDGTQVQGYYRSAPDGNPYNNYSYPGNTNPYTGKTATGNPDTYLQHNDTGGQLGSGPANLGGSSPLGAPGGNQGNELGN
jgi:hypothetical protein